MKRVLYVASNMTHIRHFHLEMIQGLQENGFLVDLASAGASEKIDGVDTCFDIPFSKRISFLKNREAVKRLRKILNEGNYDVLFCHTSLAAFFARLVLLGKKRRPYVINMVHGYLFDGNTPIWKYWLLSEAEALISPVTDLILTMNEWDTAYARRKKRGKLVQKTKGLGFVFKRFPELPESKTELRVRLGLPENDCILIYSAEFSKRKNQYFLVHLLTRLPKTTCLVLPGDGVLQSACEQLAEKLGVAGRVFIPKYQKDLNPWLRAADIAVSASQIEGLPSNVLEAMYCGLPVVASRIKGHTDLIQDGETGYLCKSERQWIDSIGKLIDDGRLRRQLGEAGHQIACAYERGNCVKDILNIWNSTGL